MVPYRPVHCPAAYGRSGHIWCRTVCSHQKYGCSTGLGRAQLLYGGFQAIFSSYRNTVPYEVALGIDFVVAASTPPTEAAADYIFLDDRVCQRELSGEVDTVIHVKFPFHILRRPEWGYLGDRQSRTRTTCRIIFDFLRANTRAYSQNYQ